MLGDKKVLIIPAFIPVDPKCPGRFLLFGDIVNGKLDIIRSQQIEGLRAGDYLKEALQIDDRDRAAVLRFCYTHLDSNDPDIATDAFHELAKASDLEIASIAGKLSPEKFRTLLRSVATPPDRLGIYAYLLGACGQKEDAGLLLEMIQAKTERGNAALSGLLGGLIELQSEKGWAAVRAILLDDKRPFADKLAAHGTLRFYHACKPKESRKEIVQCLTAVIDQGDMADMAIEDLRRWQWWEQSKHIFAQYPKPTHGAPIVRRSIVRYALCCPESEATAFVALLRRSDPEIVKRVEESLQFEKAAPIKN